MYVTHVHFVIGSIKVTNTEKYNCLFRDLLASIYYQALLQGPWFYIFNHVDVCFKANFLLYTL